MHRIDTDGHVGNLFDEGDPGVPRLPTQVDSEILNAFQEEIANYIESTGIALVKNTNTQLTSAVAATITALKAAANTWALLQTFSKGIAATQSTANTDGITAVGNGTGNGVHGTGGGTAGEGVKGTGGAGGGSGGEFVATANHGKGVVAEGFGNGSGVLATGGGSGPGIIATAGGGNSEGGTLTATGSAAGALCQSVTGPGVSAKKGSSSGSIGLTTDGTVQFTGTNPASTVGVANEFSAMNMAKAWGRLVTDGVGGVTVDGGSGAGANIASVVCATDGGGGGTITITLTAGITSNGVVVVSGQNYGNHVWGNGSATTVILTSATIDFSAVASHTGFILFGRQ